MADFGLARKQLGGEVSNEKKDERDNGVMYSGRATIHESSDNTVVSTTGIAAGRGTLWTCCGCMECRVSRSNGGIWMNN